MASEQSFEEIVNILKSLRSVKGVVIEVNSEIFGVDWAQSSDCTQPTYEGVLHSWKKKGEELYIKWPGYVKNKSVPISALENDANGKYLDLRLKNYENGSPPPVLYVPPPPRQGEDGPGDLEGDEEVGHDGENRDELNDDLIDHEPEDTTMGVEDEEDEEADEEDEEDEVGAAGAPQQLVDEGGQVWRLRDLKYVKEDCRKEQRTKPSLNKGDLSINSIVEMFAYLTPDDWWEHQLTLLYSTVLYKHMHVVVRSTTSIVRSTTNAAPLSTRPMHRAVRQTGLEELFQAAYSADSAGSTKNS